MVCLASFREKAPFVLIVETLAAEVQPPNDAAPSTFSQGVSEAGDEDGEGSARTSARRQASSQYADSVQSLLAGRLGSNALLQGQVPAARSKGTASRFTDATTLPAADCRRQAVQRRKILMLRL
jgi:hypothetical protein